MVEKVVEATREGMTMGDGPYPTESLIRALQRLDRRLAEAMAAAAAAYGSEAADDLYRGMYIDDVEVTRLLARAPGTPLLWMDGSDGEYPVDGSPLDRLRRVFGLSPFEVDLLLIALAPEFDLRYERLYAYLQDDVTRMRPTVDMALNLLCATAEDKLARRAHLAPDAPLLRHELIHLVPDPHQVAPPLLAHYLTLDRQITRFLLGGTGLDPRLAPFVWRVAPGAAPARSPAGNDFGQALVALAQQSRAVGQPLRLYFDGPPGTGQREAAAALAAGLGVPLLVADLARAAAPGSEGDPALSLLFCEARLTEAVLYLEGLEMLRGDERAALASALVEEMAGSDSLVILDGNRSWLPAGREPLGVIHVLFASPGFEERRATWAAHLAAADVTLDEDELDALSGRFRLTPAQIAEAVASASGRARWLSASDDPVASASGRARWLSASDDPVASTIGHARWLSAGGGPTLSDLFAAARAQTGHELARLAHKIEPVHTWDDIVLPADTLAQLKEICDRVAHGHRVLAEWGFGQKLALGKGLTALFSGPSGTGKTMAAGIIARELGLDLYRIDLSQVVSKYIGETEKNLDLIFAAAEASNAILFFDEADALFGKRSQVKDAHDRYANVEISYLLQKMEEHEGIAILATNLHQNMDDAFVRRLAFTIAFPFPEEEDRLRIWRGIWPAETPRAGDLDLAFLARQFKLAGGNIKNIALAAAFLAAADGQVVNMEHLVAATRRELQKMRKAVVEREFGPYARPLSRPGGAWGQGASEAT